MQSIGRRQFLTWSAGFGIGWALGIDQLLNDASAQSKLRMSFGMSLNTMGGPLVVQMQEGQMVERIAKKAGLGVTTEWLDFQALLQMLSAVAAGQLQFGMLGSTPNIRLLSTPNPAVPIALAGGGLDFPVQVTKDSPIRRVEDLKGKTVLTLVGSDLHLTFVNVLKAAFGTDDTKALNITVKNVTAVTELVRVQRGIDVYVGFDPMSRSAQEDGVLETLIHNNGTTGPHYDGPEGKGEGHELAFFKKSPFYPEAFYPHRIWWVVRQDFLAQHGDAVVAFLAANQMAATLLSKSSPEEIVKLVGDHWPGTPSAKAQVARQALWYRRGWTWITEGDARTLVGLSKVGAIFEKPLTGKQVKAAILNGTAVSRKAYEAAGSVPPANVFTDKKAKDVRGLPQWDANQWSL